MIELWRNCFRISAAVICLLLFVFAWPVSAKGNLPSSKRAKFNFNPGWKVMTGDPKGAESVDFNDSCWKKVTLPYAWNEDEAFKVDIHQLSTGVAWYRKSFRIPAVHIGQKVFLEFEGIRQAGEFYLNGQFIGRHENGVMAFGFDITKLVKFAPGVNVLAVRTNNSWTYSEKLTGQSYQWNDKNFNANYGGIVKNVYLHVTDKLYQTLPLFSTLGTTGVYIHAQDFNIADRTAQVTAESQVRNEYPTAKTIEYEVVIQDMQGKLIKAIKGDRATIAPGDTKTVKASATISDLEFWSWGYGYLYDVDTILRVNGEPVDTVRTRTGFRKTEFGNGMIKLNDRVIQVKGYAQRSSNEWPAVGLSVPPWMSDFSNRMIVEGNGNLVRWMHVTPWKQDVESCDRVGLMQAMPAGDAEKDAEGRQWEQRVELMRDAIIYNRNNPSIVFYEGGNKAVSEAHMQELKQLRDRYDPHGGRAIGCAKCSTAKSPSTAVRCSISTRAPTSRCGQWSIHETKGCENTGMNSRRRFTKMAMVRLIVMHLPGNITAIRIRMQSRTSFAGTITGGIAPVLVDGSVQAGSISSSLTHKRITAVRKTTGAAARLIRCVSPRMAFLHTR